MPNLISYIYKCWCILRVIETQSWITPLVIHIFISLNFQRYSTHQRSLVGPQTQRTPPRHPCCVCEPTNRWLSPQSRANRFLHTTLAVRKLEPFILADIGEGIKEVVIREWWLNYRISLYSIRYQIRIYNMLLFHRLIANVVVNNAKASRLHLCKP